MKAAVLLSLVGAASAFIQPTLPASKAQTSSRSLVMQAEKSKSLPFMPRPANLDGTLAGDTGFDPVGFTNWIPVNFLAEAEIKHGRIAMLATLGWIFADFVKLPGDIHQVSSLGAHDVAVKSGALTQVLVAASIFEIVSSIAVFQMVEGSGRKPGQFFFDPLNFAKDEAAWKKLSLNEVKNGRLAMLAFSGIVTQAALYEKGFPYF